jgi:hypothetical protein
MDSASVFKYKKRGRGQKTYPLGPLVELASDLDQVFST